MGRFLNLLSYAAAAVAVIYAVLNSLQSSPGFDTRRPAPHQHVVTTPEQAPLPGSGQTVVTIDVGERENATGTGFAIADGWWLTARHVVDGCDITGIATGPHQGVKARQVLIAPNADLALIQLPQSRPQFPLATAALRTGEDGYAVGYPQGRPGAVHVRAMGRLRMHSVGRYDVNEPVIAWAERERVPQSLPALAGLSGGPMFDASGAVVGVLVAESRRRGRVMTTAPASIEALLTAGQVTARHGAGDLSFAAGNFPSIGADLRQDLRVAKVICQVGGASRRPGR